MSSNAITVSGVRKSFPVRRGLSGLAARILRPSAPRTVEVLKGVDFTVAAGESVGIVGVNGSGKSTLLQIIAGTMAPSEGRVEINGKIGAILELGAGFHPEFSGRENARLGLSLMGMTSADAAALVEEVKEFSGLNDYFERPVKTYSSGMYVRLAFSVAVSGKPDILIVDEALAVGDAAFQRRCYERLSAIKKEGGTLLFVSHDEEAVRTLTDRAVLLHKGDQVAVGPSEQIAFLHRRNAIGQVSSRIVDDRSFTDGRVEDLAVSVSLADGVEPGAFQPGDTIRATVSFMPKVDLTSMNVGIRVRSPTGYKVYSGGTLNEDMLERPVGGFWARELKAGRRVDVAFEFDCVLGPGKYEIQAIVSEEPTPDFRSQDVIAWRDDAASLEVVQGPGRFAGLVDLRPTITATQD